MNTKEKKREAYIFKYPKDNLDEILYILLTIVFIMVLQLGIDDISKQVKYCIILFLFGIMNIAACNFLSYLSNLKSVLTINLGTFDITPKILKSIGVIIMFISLAVLIFKH
ncbi:MAG: hypothetical protein HKM93_20860 [Desulfobacteraceae bacterium]|nr:hypothetical protein [Desulfobacteraceae bacterium]